MSNLLRALFSSPLTTQPRQKLLTFKSLSDAELAAQTDRNNLRCAFHGLVAQSGAIEAVLDLVHQALKNPTHVSHVSAILLHGGKSNGKTMLAKLVGKSLGLPFLEQNSSTLKSIDQLFDRIQATCEDAGVPLTPLATRNGLQCYKCPNIVIFLDEIHTLSDVVVQSLLKALESKDRTLSTKSVSLDCSNVLWIGATTDRGDLFDAFESRFYKIQLLSYTVAEVQAIVKLNYPGWTDRECETVARLAGQIAREALDFAVAIEANAERCHCDRLTALENVRRQRGLHENGMTRQQIWALKALADSERGLNYEQLARTCQCKVAELKAYVLPRLMLSTEDHPPSITWTGSRSYITESGRELLASMKGI